MGLTLEQSARWAGAHQWAESRLFEVLGGWVATTPEPDVRLMLDRHSRHAAWRAAQWWDRLPVLADLDRATLCAAPSPPVEEVAARLATLEGTVARLAGAYRVALPRLWAAYGRHQEDVDGVADASSIRALRIVSPDLAADWQEGEVRLQKMVGDGTAAAAAANTVASLEEVLASAG